MPTDEFSLKSARQAADDDRLADWVTDFLASPGSDNEALAAALALGDTSYLGPVRFELDRLTPMAGPDEAEVVVAIPEQEWEEDVASMTDSLEDGWEPPPLLVSERPDGFYLEDGNHRHESLRRNGETEAWAIILRANDPDGDGDPKAQVEMMVTPETPGAP